MKTAVITAEYNPFHNGHIYHITETKRLTDAENIIAVMSGNFVQRGAPALTDKWQRAKCALQNGVDMVIELPFLYACSSAEFFASAAVSTAAKSGIADFFSFGCETDNLELIKNTAKILVNESDLFKKDISLMLNKGVSYPLARQKALEKSNCEIDLSPNNILAVEYLKELIKTNSSIKPISVKRYGNEYSSENTDGKFISATAIRKAVLNGKIENICGSIPNETYKVLKNAIKNQNIFTEDMFSPYLDFVIRNYGAEGMADILDIREGIENRIYKAVECCSTFSDICSFVKSKRYTYTSVSRALFHVLFSVKKNDMEHFRKIGYIPYFRILGFRKEKSYLIRKLEDSGIPVIINVKKDEEKLDDYGHFLFDLEKRTTDIYFGCCKNQTFRKTGLEYTVPPVII
ncbi:MAG: nucleotidyltransferase [Clostridia bacterium]|jgi:predicted nucleotidyltransferase|nr:nucleotidyltransferase [Clostridia bacterium]